MIGSFRILRNSLDKIIIPFRGVVRKGRQTGEIRASLPVRRLPGVFIHVTTTVEVPAVIARRLFGSLLAVGLMMALLHPSAVAQEKKDAPELIRAALESPNVDRQRAALVLIPELGLKDAAATATAKHLDNYLKKSQDDKNTALALIALGRLKPPTPIATGVLKTYLESKSAEVRQAAGKALVELCAGSAREFGRPFITTSGSVSTVGISAGSAAATTWTRTWVPALINEERVWLRFAEDAKVLLPFCSQALRDPDDKVKASGAEGIRLFARAAADVLPDPSTSNPETKAIDPFEAKLKWLMLQPVFEALNTNVASLKNAMTASDPAARQAATRAAEAVSQARALALATRRYEPADFTTLSAKPVPEDSLKNASENVLPAALALDDPSPDIRLIAVEAFEHQGPDARSQLPAIIKASSNSDIFVRWVATRTLGRLFSDATPAEASKIVEALAARMDDQDLDVRNAALTALAKGGDSGKAAGPAVLKIAVNGDPDQQVLAIRTLAGIDADQNKTVPALAQVLTAEPARVRQAAVMYLGSVGPGARSVLPQLRPLLLDPEEDVRREAARALLAIEGGR